MLERIKVALLHGLRTKESWVIFFIMGIIMMNYPFISIFNKPVLFFSLPALYLYLHLGWIISILVIFIFTKANHLDDNVDDQKGEHH